MADKKVSELDAATSVSSTDFMVINQGGVTKRAAISLLPYVTQGSAANFITSASAQGLIDTAVSNAVSAGGYVTSASVSTMITSFGYITSASTSTLAKTIVESYGYITSASASSLTQSILTTGQYLTSASVSVLAKTVTESYGYITSASASALTQSIINTGQYITSASASALAKTVTESYGYITSTSASTLTQSILNSGQYVTSASASVIADHVVSTRAVQKFGVVTTAAGNAAGVETDLMSYIIPANTFTTGGGKVIRIHGWGTAVSNANTKQVRVYVANTTVLDNGNMGANFTNQWFCEVLLISTSTNNQDYFVGFERNAAAGTDVTSRVVGTLTQNIAVATTVKFTASASANNDVVMEGMLVEFLA